MNAVLLIDFGSTYTKVTAVDTDTETILGNASSYTTVETDINDGLTNALKKLEEKTGPIEYAETLACSSAAGGLRMMASGLVPDLTTKAATMATLGAGAKLVKAFSYELTEEDIEEIDAFAPDLFLLTGGIDGGNVDNMINNSKMLATLKGNFPIIIAGNRTAVTACKRNLKDKIIYVSENVMPKFDQLNVEPVQNLIRDIFLERIVNAKGLSTVTKLLDEIMMPTPVSLLQAMKLLANGTETEDGIGEIFGVDLGGATTDVYSIATGAPRHMMTVVKGLPEPYAKRTVEGDIGMRYNIEGIVESVGIARIAELSGLKIPTVERLMKYFTEHTDRLPESEEEKSFEFALASAAVETATSRHAGILEEVYTPMGETFVQTGKDLTDVRTIIGTGGALVYVNNPDIVRDNATQSMRKPNSLRPEKAEVYIDEKYILSAMGLLSERYPDIALRILKKELCSYGT